MNERRHEERRPAPRMSAICLALHPRLWEQPPNFARRLLDISTGGVRLLLSEPIPAGEQVTIRLTDAKTSRSVRVGAEVRWLKTSPLYDDEGTHYEAGFRFTRSRGLLELLTSQGQS